MYVNNPHHHHPTHHTHHHHSIGKFHQHPHHQHQHQGTGTTNPNTPNSGSNTLNHRAHQSDPTNSHYSAGEILVFNNPTRASCYNNSLPPVPNWEEIKEFVRGSWESRIAIISDPKNTHLKVKWIGREDGDWIVHPKPNATNNQHQQNKGAKQGLKGPNTGNAGKSFKMNSNNNNSSSTNSSTAADEDGDWRMRK